ncbi:TPA: hypothetical protein ACRZZI_004970 [Vibrio harveyi]
MVAVLGRALIAFGTKLFMSVATEKMIEWLFFYIAEQVVITTKTTHDEEFLQQLKKAYYK